MTDPRRGATEYTHDGEGRVTSRPFADRAVERALIDDAANTVRCLDTAGRITTMTRSGDNSRCELIDAVGGKSTIEFDGQGQPIKVTGPTGRTARMRYDNLRRLEQVENPASGLTRFDSTALVRESRPSWRPTVRANSFNTTRGNLIGTSSANAPCNTGTIEYYPDGLLKRSVDCQGGSRRLPTTLLDG